MGEPARERWSARNAARLRGVPLSAADEARYEAERVLHNRRSIRAAAMVLLPIHALVALVFWPAGGLVDGASSFRGVICLADLLMIPLVLTSLGLLLVVEPRWSPRWWQGWAADLYALAYVLIGVALSVNAQRMNGNLNIFTLALMGNALLIRQRAWAVAAQTGIGLALLIAGIWWIQPSLELRRMAIAPALTAAGIALLLSRLAVASARNELVARLTIERQRAELEVSHREQAALNRELERRVREQVEEIVVRATEIEKLNRHLATQVVERSRHLARAFRALGPGTTRTLAPGTIFAGRVEILGHLGAGAWGDVYRGHDRILERDVAVKVLRQDCGVSTGAWVRFAAEAGAAAAVRHPCVVHTLHVGVADDGRLYQLQELIDGVTLAEALERGGTWPASSAARLGGELAAALAAAHAAGIVHRDVKPSNVMLTAAAPGVRLLDFGISKTLTPGTDGSTGIDLVGTPICMAPEQIAEPESVSPAADVYALGVLLHELIAGEPPFVGGMAKLLHQHLEQAPPRLDDARAPAPLADLVLRCLAKDPRARPTAREVADVLGAFADTAGAPPPERLPRPALEQAADRAHAAGRATVSASETAS